MTITKRTVKLIVGVLITLMFGGMLCILSFVDIPESSRDVLQVLIGALSGSFVTMVAFYFGDSDGQTPA